MSSSSAPVITVDNVSKFFEIYEKPVHRLWQMCLRGRKQFYRPFWALNEVSFEVGRGECVGIIGRNGSGKSTLLQIIAGTLSPSSGAVRTSGRVAALLELGSGFNPEFTGRENVYMNAAILGLSSKEIDAKYEAIAAFADIGEFIDQPVKSYSSGMVVRLAFAVVAHVDAEVLIIDEALAVGDAFFTQKCMHFLRNFIKEHTVLFVSHDVAAVNSLCNRAVLLDSGRVSLIGSPKEVTEKYMECMFESIQGKSSLPASDSSCSDKPSYANLQEMDYRDMRQDIINASNLRNDIEVFRFNEEGSAFGKGGASIENAFLLDEQGRPLHWIVGGEMVNLRVYCMAHKPLTGPIIGFQFKDRLGQILFGDNTFLSYMDKPLFVAAGERLETSFSFRMPLLAAGDYFFSIAVAEGSQEKHVQHQWLHEAIKLTSANTSMVTGIVGIPVQNISMQVL